ncbi:host cell division inhibitor Icd-like protein [Pantoea agglomerans]|uniref:host cell division inhibitor Icd-like protein n=1 Tax=Enterobacter agglomerans TaxID=549 RepID=UPI002ED0B8CA|nr:host cell division inhibitor Icd-like protein [Pantoea agglomerans]
MNLRVIWWMPVYTKNSSKKVLRWMPVGVYSGCQLGVAALTNSEALKDCRPYRASNHNVTEAYTMAYSHSTQTRPEKHLWRFLALDRADMNAIPRRVSVEAPTEHDARLVLAPYFILSLAARLPAQGVCNV